jgi:hypothetical protein
MECMFVVFRRKRGLKRKRRSGLRQIKERYILFCFALLIIKTYTDKKAFG